MIAKNITPIRGLILVCIIVTPFFSNARLKSVALVYDQQEVYEGNRFRISLKTADHKDRTYYSTNDGRYSFDDFKVSSSQNVDVIGLSREYIVVDVKTDGTEEFEISVQYNYGNRTIYPFTIKKIDYRKEIDSIFIHPSTSTVRNRDKLSYSISAKLKDDSKIWVKESGKLKYDMFNVSLLSGGTINTDNQTISVYQESLCNPTLFLSVSLKSNVKIRHELSIPIIHARRTRIDFSAANFQTSGRANSGSGGRSAGIFQGDDGGQGSHGISGTSGNNGKDGKSLQIYLSWFKSNCVEDSLIKVQIKNEDDRELETVYIQPDIDLLMVQSNGGDGVDGQSGGHGGNGGSGRFYLFESTREMSTSGDGGNGGNGGNGGDGGDGGNGGSIIVYYPPELASYLDQLVLIVNPGKGGKGGLGGNPGIGGEKGNGGSQNGSVGQQGSYGRNGRNGRPGFAGNVVFIEIQN